MEQLISSRTVIPLVRLVARKLLRTNPAAVQHCVYATTQADTPIPPSSSTAKHGAPETPVFPSRMPDVAPGTSSSEGPRMTTAGILFPKDTGEKIADLKKEEKQGKDKRQEQRQQTERNTKCDTASSAGTMKAWQISKFNDVGGMKLEQDVKVPSLSDPFDMLVEIHAASVNPFDIERTRGYGENLIQYIRTASKFSWMPQTVFTRKEQPFPLTLGRDFSGVVVDAGSLVHGVKTGDEIFGVIGPHRQGTFAQYATTSTWCVAKKPATISHAEAASLPYIACTAWSVLKLIENLPAMSEKRVLVIGGSGGVGSFSIQYLKALRNVHVTAVCGTAAIDMVASLGADDIIDYQASDVESELQRREKFDFIFQATRGDYDFSKKYLKGMLKSFFVTLNYPLLKNIDERGSVAGLAKSAADYSIEYAKGLSQGYHTVWAFFAPNGPFLQDVAKRVEKGQIRPIVDKVYPFEELPAAFQQVEAGDTKGKVIIEMKK
ncbi:reticulon-4-interacting protein 1, mitochondrial-like [Paramacrobiotus metropolitanus]|uniref:reticulon-4-interacting protein 1, mitochondrial-like n=1 Tax=Paramacrobiotus metropolitanus TaxID=2943436 RepID=UPI002445C63F|nr:reticulon-4-interacting protein 1, mitochondrial-like [Paramacrobiotus metropolitanus]